MTTYSHHVGQAALDRSGNDQHPSVESMARERVADNSLFRGRHTTLSFHYEQGNLVLTGRLPSFYLKQVLQSIVRHIDGVETIENRVDVINCQGLSSSDSDWEKSA